MILKLVPSTAHDVSSVQAIEHEWPTTVHVVPVNCATSRHMRLLVVSQSVAVGTGSKRTPAKSGIRWYELRSPNATPVVYQQGTFSPDAAFRWMGSGATDKQGNIAFGYSVSSSTMSPAIRYATRAASDPLGILSNETSIVEGTGSQTGTLHRWGDYATMVVDPSDDCTFWFTSEYLKTNGTFNWSTRIASFKVSACQ